MPMTDDFWKIGRIEAVLQFMLWRKYEFIHVPVFPVLTPWVFCNAALRRCGVSTTTPRVDSYAMSSIQFIA